MESSLCRQVYTLVTKDGSEATMNLQQMFDRHSQLAVLPIKPRTPILEQYRTYAHNAAKPKSVALRKRPPLNGGRTLATFKFSEKTEPNSPLPLKSEAVPESVDMSGLLNKFERHRSTNYKINREDLKEFLKQNFNVTCPELVAIEGVHFCRGAQLEKGRQYDRSKLIQWLQMQVPILQTSQRYHPQPNKQPARPTSERSIDVADVVRQAQLSSS